MEQGSNRPWELISSAGSRELRCSSWHLPGADRAPRPTVATAGTSGLADVCRPEVVQGIAGGLATRVTIRTSPHDGIVEKFETGCAGLSAADRFTDMHVWITLNG